MTACTRREVVAGLRGQLRSYRSEGGRELLDVADGVIVSAETPAPPRFLPEYDNLFLSHDDRARIAGAWYPEDRSNRGKLFVDGFLAGGWRIETKPRTPSRLIVDLFRKLTAEEAGAVGVEADALVRFLAPDAERPSVEMAVIG